MAISTQLSITTLSINGLNAPIKRYRVAQCARNLTAVAWVTVENSGLKDPALSQLQQRLQLQLGFNPWPGNLHMLHWWLLKKIEWLNGYTNKTHTYATAKRLTSDLDTD